MWRPLPAIAILLSASLVHAQALSPWVGQRVVTKKKTPMKIGKQVVDDQKDFRVYTVETTKGDWLWLVSGSHRGWVRSGSVVPFDRAIDYHTQQIQLLPTAWSYIKRGMIRSEMKQYDNAIADFTKAIQLDPRSALAFGNRSKAWFDKKEYDRALADSTEAIQLDPMRASAFIRRGNTWFAKKEYDKALDDYNEAIRLEPTYAMAFNNRGYGRWLKKEYDKALADFNEAIRLDPKIALAFNNRGGYWTHKQEYDKALADCNEAIRLDPNYAGAFNNRGNVWQMKKEYGKALADYTEAIRLDPKDAMVFRNRGNVWSLKKEYDKVLADCNEAIRLDPNSAIAFNIRGNVWFSKQVYDKALADYNEAIRLDPKYASAFYDQAWLLATCPDEKCRDGVKAVESATRACELGGWKCADCLDTLAAAYAEAGDFARAGEWQEKANALFTDTEFKKEGNDRLALYKDRKPYRDAPKR